jgi:hypothetical protein
MTVRGPVITDEYMMTAEEKEENNRRIRESYALWFFDDNWSENEFLHSADWATVKKEFMKTNPWL